MSYQSPSKYLTETEKKRFDALARFDTVKAAAVFLGIEPSTLYNWIWNLNKRYQKRHGWCNAVLAQRRRGRLLRKLLSKHKREPLKAVGEKEEEEEW